MEIRRLYQRIYIIQYLITIRQQLFYDITNLEYDILRNVLSRENVKLATRRRSFKHSFAFQKWGTLQCCGSKFNKAVTAMTLKQSESRARAEVI